MAMPAEQENSNSGPYKNFQLLAYEVPTAAWNATGVLSAWNVGNCPELKDKNVLDPKLVQGNCSMQEYTDARNRIRRLAGVVQRTYENGGARRWNIRGFLNIFVVPEFYFRPSHEVHATCSYDGRLAQQIFAELGRIFSDPVFSNWIFVCGTVVYRTGQAGSEVYHNTAVIVPGGEKNASQLLEKQNASGIDGVPTASTPGNIAPLKARLEGYADVRKHFITMKGIELGVEICLEHHLSILRGVTQKYVELERKSHPGVQLHILTAGGMNVVQKSIAARKGGYLLRVDGVSGPPSELLYVRSWKGNASDPPGPADTGTTAETQQITVTEKNTETPIDGQLLLPDPPGAWHVSVAKQQVQVYPIKTIPS
jgi:hypothetical protein